MWTNTACPSFLPGLNFHLPTALHAASSNPWFVERAATAFLTAPLVSTMKSTTTSPVIPSRLNSYG